MVLGEAREIPAHVVHEDSGGGTQGTGAHTGVQTHWD